MRSGPSGTEGAKILPKTRYPETLVTLVNTANNLLAKIEKGGAAEATGTEVQAVTTWATDNPPKAWSENPPKAATLYKDDPESILPFPTGAVLKTPDSKGADPKKVGTTTSGTSGTRGFWSIEHTPVSPIYFAKLKAAEIPDGTCLGDRSWNLHFSD